jgi:hypothetical protein
LARTNTIARCIAAGIGDGDGDGELNWDAVILGGGDDVW